MPKKKALDRDERKRQIILAFAVELNNLHLELNPGNNYVCEMTVADIARHLHLSPSSKLRAIIMELVIDGVLDFRDEKIPGVAKFRRLYSPDAKTFKRPKAEYGRAINRPIKINSRQGSFFAQLREDENHDSE